jgi:MFS family permease
MTTVVAPAGRRAVVLTLAVSEARLQLVAVAYPLTFGSLLIVFGRAGDLFGRRR